MKGDDIKKLQANLQNLIDYEAKIIDIEDDTERENKLNTLYQYFNTELELDKCKIPVRFCIERDINYLIKKYGSTEIIKQIEEKFKKYLDRCSICLQLIPPNEEVKTDCNHIFHKDCLKRLSDKKCPNCRKELNIKITNNEITWYQNNLIHRDKDLPAIIDNEGNKFWYQNNLIHRDNDLPAVIKKDGSKFWYQNGLLHRDNDLPAIEERDGSKYWYQNGLLHRDAKDKNENFLPAVILSDGSNMIFINGELQI
jgi:hypothetical protein